jgi:hypothetical protein
LAGLFPLLAEAAYGNGECVKFFCALALWLLAIYQGFAWGGPALGYFLGYFFK